MRSLPLALGAATLGAFAAIIALAVYSEVVRDLPFLLLHTQFVAKAAILLSLGVFGVATLLPRRPGGADTRWTILGMLALGVGLIVTVLTVSNPGLINVVQPSDRYWKVRGLQLIQDFMPLAFGLLAATVATARAAKT